MQEGKWLYQIGKNTMGVVVSLIPLVLFGGVALWLSRTGNPAAVLAGLFTLLALAVTLAGVYRLLFVKLLVSENGFFHQTRPGNGRFYRYNQLQNAWSSSGTGQTGATGLYFHYQLKGKPPVRVFCTHADQEGIDYVLQQFQAYQHSRGLSQAQHEPEQYEITGKTYGKSYLVIAVVVLALFLFMELPMVLRNLSTHHYGLALFSGAGAVAMVVVIAYLAVRMHSFQVKIDARGFYLRTTPFNGKYYRFTDIKECREIRRVYRHRSSGGGVSRNYAFLFSFTDRSGVTRKFFFQKDIFNHEIQVLKARIAQANHQQQAQPSPEVDEPTQIWRAPQSAARPRTRPSQGQNQARPARQAAPSVSREVQPQPRASRSQPRASQPQARPHTPAPARSRVPAMPLLLLGIVLLGVGLYLLSPHISSALHLKPQNNSWSPITATVVNVSSQGGEYSVVYSYAVSGKSYQNSTTSDTPVQLGDTMTVYYNPASPQFSRDSVAESDQETVPLTRSLLGGVSTAVGLGCIVVVAWSLGKPATAPVKVRRNSNQNTR